MFLIKLLAVAITTAETGTIANLTSDGINKTVASLRDYCFNGKESGYYQDHPEDQEKNLSGVARLWRTLV